MSGKRKPTTGLNFRPNSDRADAKGTRPTAEPSSVKSVFLMVLQHICRKWLFINIYYRVAFYLAMIFVISVIMDFAPMPRTTAVGKDNFFNAYFVKVGWGWTLLLGIPFVSVTSFVYCCGKREKIFKHVSRLIVATFFWYTSTGFFNYVETIYGRCNVKDERLQTKSLCLRKGYYWQSVDISGHCFILIYSTLVLIEECRVINGWERIADLLRDEEHERLQEETANNRNPLRVLHPSDFELLTNSYRKLTPYVRSLFIGITGLILIWEFMLIATVIFYHSMLEKLLAGLVAVAVWYFTYYILFANLNFVFTTPGEGEFKYNSEPKTPTTLPPITKRRQTLTKTPTISTNSV